MCCTDDHKSLNHTQHDNIRHQPLELFTAAMTAAHAPHLRLLMLRRTDLTAISAATEHLHDEHNLRVATDKNDPQNDARIGVNGLRIDNDGVWRFCFMPKEHNPPQSSHKTTMVFKTWLVQGSL